MDLEPRRFLPDHNDQTQHIRVILHSKIMLTIQQTTEMTIRWEIVN